MILVSQPPTNPIIDKPIAIVIQEKQPEPTEASKLYTVVEGDSLTSIAEATQSTVDRLWDANPQLTHPDVITPSQELKIPDNEEVLTDRPMPANIKSGNATSYGTTPSDVNHSPRSGGYSSSGLIGSIGYARAGGNCVSEPGVNSPRNGTNPISWAVLSRTPTIGATVLFHYNHTGVVTGIWSNGDIEIRHQNYGYNQHRFPPSTFRGYR